MFSKFYLTTTSLARTVLPVAVANQIQTLIRNCRFRNRSRRLRRRNAHWKQLVQDNVTFDLELRAGVQLRVYPDSELCRLIYLGGYESIERDFVSRYLRPGDVFVDVGANVGLYTVLASKMVGDTGSVHSFEPCSKTFRRLEENVRLNRCVNVELHQIALSDHRMASEMVVALDGYDAWNSLGKPPTGRATEREPVQMATWDDFSETLPYTSRMLMKVDIEGWESHFLRGARRALRAENAPVLIMEFDDGAAALAGSSGQQVYSQLCELGYLIFAYDALTKRLLPEPMRNGYRYANLIATKNLEQVQSRVQTGWGTKWTR